MCRWWSGCKDSWRAQSGRPRRTKPRGWCSSERWGAGPSDNLWSEEGLDEASADGDGSWGSGGWDPTATVPRSALESKAAFRELLSLPQPQAVTIKPSPSPLQSKACEYSPRKAQRINLDYCLCVILLFLFSPRRAKQSVPKCYVHGCQAGTQVCQRKNAMSAR